MNLIDEKALVMVKWPGKRQHVAPDEIRSVREAAGWSQEQVAAELGVLPVEVSAWESGAIRIDRYQAEQMRWRMAHAEYEAALPRSQCYWMRASEARLERMREQGPFSSMRAEHEAAAHTLECAECMRVQALLLHAPPPPEPPAEPGFRGWLRAARSRITRLPGWLRIPLQALDSGVAIGKVYLLVELLRWADSPSKGFHLSLGRFALLFAGVTWLAFLFKRLLPMADRRPYLAGQLLAGGMALPATLLFGLLGDADLSAPGPWIFAGLVSVFVGGVLGKWVEEEREKEVEADDPPQAAPAAEERVVVIEQQDHSWRA